ncbi:MAG: extracellular solute-binding protein [Acetanaerobacterium sp.]
MKKPRKIALAMVGVLLIGALSACGSSAPAAPSAGSAAPADSAAPAESSAPAGKAAELTVWDIWTTGADNNSTAWIDTVIPEYQAKYPEVTINRESTENEAYKTKFAAAQAANTLPDVFFGWGPASARELANANMLLDLGPYLDDTYMSTVNPGSLDNFTFNDKIYGLTMYSWSAALYCNTEMFKANNLDLPTTYDELLAAIDGFKAAGITPIALPAADAWTVAFFQHIMAIRYTGAENVNAMLKGEKSFNDPGIVKSAQALLDLVDRGAFDANAIAAPESEITTRFQNGDFPMYYLGDWLVSGIENPENSTVVGKIAAINFPGVGGEFDDQVLGGATDGFMISAATENPDAAVEFLKFTTARLPEVSYSIGGTIPTRSNFDMTKYSPNLPPLSAGIADYASKASGMTLAWDTFLPQQPKDKMLSMLQQLVGKQLTAEEFAKNMAAVCEETGYAKY